MASLSMHRALAAAVVVAGLVCSAVEPIRGERLAARRFTTADGLAGDYVLDLHRDSRGFLWFATRDGLSRFDGVRFVTYGIAEGLPTTTINNITETRSGAYWVSTNAGLSEFHPNGRRGDASTADERPRLFTTYRVGNDEATNRVNVVFDDREGRLWIGTDDGLYQLERNEGTATFRKIPLPLVPTDGSYRAINALVEDSEGSLWIGGGSGLLRRLPDGRFVVYRGAPASDRDIVDTLHIDGQQRLWAGYRSGLLRLDATTASSFAGDASPVVRTFDRRPSPTPTLAEPPNAGAGRDRAFWYTTANGLPDDGAGALFFPGNGHVWVGTTRGVAEFDGERFRPRNASSGIAESEITDIVTDSSGGIWVASVTGVTRVIRNGLVTYDNADGLPNSRVHSVSQDAAGRLLIIDREYQVSRLEGSRFVTTRPAALGDASCLWLSRCGYLDRGGNWWIANPRGLFRWDAAVVDTLSRHAPNQVYSSRNGLPHDSVFSVFEDQRGSVWAGTAPGSIVEWQRGAGTWRQYSEADGLPALKGLNNPAVAFAEDRSGSLWIAFEQGEIVRRRNGRFEALPAAGRPRSTLTSLHVDAAGRLWIGSSQTGLIRVDDPSADRPVATTLTASDGLGSNNVRCFTEDRAGRIYVGTSRGIDRFDPATRTVTHFSSGEGLASDFVTAAFRDKDGVLWFGTMLGLSRFDPAGDEPAPGTAPAPAIFIADIRAGRESQYVAELGDAEPAALTLPPDRNQLEIGFFGFSFESGAPLRYQYRLEGADSDWSSPTSLTSVNLAELSPGSYRFLVRAVRADGGVSASPAVVSFTVLPPIYARWWFIVLVAASLAGVGLMLYRTRVARLVGVERIRARIATDLHDDIGASLSQIAILAEVSRERLSRESVAPETTEPLVRIAETSRTLVDAMGDIVWAINPDRDALRDVVYRMRRFVEDTLGASDIDTLFHAPEHSQHLKLGADVRREVFLILKESVANIVKHAECTRVTIDFTTDRHRLLLRIVDNGRGFDPAQRTDGNGLASMRRRVESLGGRLTIDSAPGRGTTISLNVEIDA